MSIIELMGAPFAECLVLVAIHTYLGIHVLKRRVIFVDLALAQIAALGTTVGFLFGIMPDTSGALLFSMGFTFLGAAVFALTRFRQERVPQEAVIGLAYAICCAMAVLVVDKTKGAEHLKDILVGSLLWVRWSDVATAAVAYLVVGVIHLVFRKKFFCISEDPEAAYAAGIAVRAWDFLFYVTFGLVITLSTRVAGVLLVFVFLVAPAILAFIVTTRLWHQLLIGWTTGTVVTVLGLYLSWKADLPSGPAVIALYGVALVVGALGVYLWRAHHRAHALRTILLGCAATALVVAVMWGGGHCLGASTLSVSAESRQVASSLSRERAAAATAADQVSGVRRATMAGRVGRCVGPNKIDRYLAFAGPEERLQHVRAKLAEDTRRGLEFLLLALADDELPLLYREEGAELLVGATEDAFGYDAQAEHGANQASIARICDHIRALKKATGDEPGAPERKH